MDARVQAAEVRRIQLSGTCPACRTPERSDCWSSSPQRLFRLNRRRSMAGEVGSRNFDQLIELHPIRATGGDSRDGRSAPSTSVRPSLLNREDVRTIPCIRRRTVRLRTGFMRAAAQLDIPRSAPPRPTANWAETVGGTRDHNRSSCVTYVPRAPVERARRSAWGHHACQTFALHHGVAGNWRLQTPTPDGTRSVGQSRQGARRVRGYPRFLQFDEQRRQRAIEHSRRIAVRYRVAHQVLNSTQLVVRLAIDGELHLVALGREGRDHRTRPAARGAVSEHRSEPMPVRSRTRSSFDSRSRRMRQLPHGTRHVGPRRSSATSSSTCRLLLCVARERTSRWFSSVSTFASKPTVVSVTSPEIRRSKTAGKRRPTRAASIRLYERAPRDEARSCSR